MSIGIVEKLFEPWRVLFHPMGAINSFDIPLSHRNLKQLPFALVSTKEAFAYFCLLTKVCRSQSAALRNKRLLSAVEALTLTLVLKKEQKECPLWELSCQNRLHF
jgi:hypothetical protein